MSCLHGIVERKMDVAMFEDDKRKQGWVPA